MLKRIIISHGVLMFLTIFTLTALVGCSISAQFTPSTNSFVKSTRSIDDIEIFIGGDKPDRPYKIVGIVSTNWFWKGARADQQEVFTAMRKEAAKYKLDGILDVESVRPGVEGEGLCSGKGFVYIK